MKVRVLGNGPWGAILRNEIHALGHDVRVSNSRMPAVDPSHVDAVVFATPPDVQEKLAPKWIAAGVPCFLEKPLALTVDGAYEIWRAATGVGGHGVVCCDHLRTMPSSWQMFRNATPPKPDAVRAAVGGPGPVRTWPVKHPFLWDYGPHALAYVLDVVGGEVSALNTEFDEDRVKAFFEVDGIECSIGVSNNVTEKVAVVRVEVENKMHDYRYDSAKERPLTATLQAFFNAIEGKASVPSNLSLARAVKIVEILEEIEEDIERRSK